MFFIFTPTSCLFSLSLHDALPISPAVYSVKISSRTSEKAKPVIIPAAPRWSNEDRKSTRLNSSHVANSYAVFCLKKKKMNVRNRLLHASIASAQVHMNVYVSDQ